MGSSIHKEHVEVFHRSSHEGLLILENQASQIADWNPYFEYDPYFGTLHQLAGK